MDKHSNDDNGDVKCEIIFNNHTFHASIIVINIPILGRKYAALTSCQSESIN